MAPFGISRWSLRACTSSGSRQSAESSKPDTATQILSAGIFPVPPLTEKNKADLTRCAEDILLAREAHFPATIADLYDPDEMPDDLRAAHERNDETLERIYIGRRFKNDTERLEKLFELYSKVIAAEGGKAAKGKATKKAKVVS